MACMVELSYKRRVDGSRMELIEKVISGLECCSKAMGCNASCPYVEECRMWKNPAIEEAIAILKSQIPRLLSLDEIVPGMIVYYEDRYYNDRRWVCEVVENKHKRFQNDIILSGCGNIVERSKSSYGETWRLWSGKPGEDMMKGEIWNEC